MNYTSIKLFFSKGETTTIIFIFLENANKFFYPKFFEKDFSSTDYHKNTNHCLEVIDQLSNRYLPSPLLAPC